VKFQDYFVLDLGYLCGKKGIWSQACKISSVAFDPAMPQVTSRSKLEEWRAYIMMPQTITVTAMKT